MFVALAAAVAIGALIAVATVVDERLRIADDLGVSLLVCVSGSVAGWALIDAVGGLGEEGLNGWGLAGAVVGAILIAQAAWRGRRRTFDELGLTPHSE